MEQMQTELWHTQNDLPERVRRDAISHLNQQLADAVDLHLQAKQAHWNVKGANFFALHELFDAVGEELEELADEIAERAVVLGGTALGTARTSAARSRLPVYPLQDISSADHVTALSTALAAFAKSTRAAIDVATTQGDAVTADVFTGVARGVDRLLWRVEAHNA
jgi:starvation-inducible DNA-binding protein